MLHLVYNSDGGFVMPTLVSAASAVAWTSDLSQLVIHVLDTGIEDDEWWKFEETLRHRFGVEFGIQRHQIDCALFAGLRKWRGVSYATYARVLDAEVLKEVSWCLHCDGDTLFTDDPLNICAEYDSSCAMQGHVDWQKAGIPSAQQLWFQDKGLGWDPEQYVCCGVMLVNLDWFRANDVAEKCLDFLRRYPDAPFVDQEPLNYFCRGKIGYLPNRWGMFSWDAFRTVRPGCLHYASDLPWKLMTNRYLDYNDAHKLWFFYVEKLLGFRFGTMVEGGVRPFIFARKMAFRMVFKVVRALCSLVPVLSHSAIGDYCLRHYSSKRQWRELTDGLCDRR